MDDDDQLFVMTALVANHLERRTRFSTPLTPSTWPTLYYTSGPTPYATPPSTVASDIEEAILVPRNAGHEPTHEVPRDFRPIVAFSVAMLGILIMASIALCALAKRSRSSCRCCSCHGEKRETGEIVWKDEKRQIEEGKESC